MMTRPSPCEPVRCLRCRMHINLCVCDLMPSFDVGTRVHVLMQKKEFHITTNTGHLIPKIFKNSGLTFHGDDNRKPVSVDDLNLDLNTTHVLFPVSGARILNEDFAREQKSSVTLLVLDGNWGQASKMMRRLSFLHDLPKLQLPTGLPSTYRLRTTARKSGLCTFESVAHSLGILESIQIRQQLLDFFDVFVERVLWTRGKLEFENVSGWGG